MKSHLKTYAMLATCILSSAIAARAVQVSFQVNMSAQTSLGNFDPTTDSVVVAGDAINSWNTAASPLSISTTDTNIWEGTFDVPGTAGSTVQYKYVMNKSSGLVWEGNVGSGSATGNRTFTLAATNQTLPTVYFNNVTNSSSVTNAITFQLDMSVQTALGNFDPASSTLNIAGEFNNWNATATPLTNSVSNTNIWTTTLVLSGAVGGAVQYKYIMGGTWEGNVGPSGAQNRAVTLTRTNQILAAVYFNNLASIPIPLSLVFQVNLAAQTALGNFNPATDIIEARGTFNNWAAGFALTNSPQNPTVYSGTMVDSSDPVGGAIQYQYVLNNGTTWETAVGNRTYTLTSTSEQILPLVFFNNVDNLGPISLHVTGNGQSTLGWTAGPLLRLQSAVNLSSGPWQDIPNTQGSNSLTVPIGPGQKFYRLIGP